MPEGPFEARLIRLLELALVGKRFRYKDGHTYVLAAVRDDGLVTLEPQPGDEDALGPSLIEDPREIEPA